MTEVKGKKNRVDKAMYDTIIYNISVYNGTGGKPFIADIGIKGKFIAAIGTLDKKANSLIDGSGLAISPGFIDIHTHDEYAAIQNPDMSFKIMQGVTSSIVGNCGFSVAPYKTAMKDSIISRDDDIVQWDGHKGYLQYLTDNPTSINIGLLAGHNTFHSAVVGNDKRNQPAGNDIMKMQSYLREGLEAGAVGLSAGLFYIPGCYSRTEEIISLLKICINTNAVFTIHMRNEDDDLINAIKEAVRIAEESEVAMEISHFKACGKKNWGKADEALGLIHNAVAGGLNITVDQYPYSSGSTSLKEIARSGAFAGKGMDLHYSQAIISSSKIYPDSLGMDIESIAEKYKITPKKALNNLIETDDPVATFLNTMGEEDIRKIMSDPLTIIASDGIPVKGNPHPRLYGTFPRSLSYYARDEKVLTMETAIHKMTEKPAKKFNLKCRGLIKENNYADLVIFDKNKIAAEPDYHNSRQYPKGIIDVFVNGTRVVKNGKHTSARAGQILLRED
ncbi:MAG TPA: D-aminoacylase [Victivallales bacterium]|nr:D-aminoacylase [Victivallales bacterium]